MATTRFVGVDIAATTRAAAFVEAGEPVGAGRAVIGRTATMSTPNASGAVLRCARVRFSAEVCRWSGRLRMGSGGADAARALYADQRKRVLLEALRRDGRVDAAAIAGELRVTGETIRKDLIQLERQGLLRRVHGGAVPVAYLSFEPSVDARTGFLSEKVRIARAALAQVPDRGAVLVDAGSTTAQLVEVFPGDRELTVYTNALPLALSLLTRPLVTVFTLGGRVRAKTFAEVEDWAARALAEINVDVAFVGANGVSVSRGLTTPDPSEAAVKRRMLSCARRRVLLADHSKVGVVSGVRYGDLQDIDLLITDTGLATEQLDALRAAGVEVQRA